MPNITFLFNKIFTVLTLLISINTFATTYYISPTGDDNHTGLGAADLVAWKHLSYAMLHAINPSDIIHVVKQGATPYPTETTMMLLRPGVSIIGEGTYLTGLSKITCTYNNTGFSDGSIQLSGGAGGQSISFLELDGGSLAGRSAITVVGRSNVSIHDCYIHDFLRWGICMQGTSSYIQGWSIYNCNIINCSDRTNPAGGGDLNNGLIRAWGYDGLLIHDNTLRQDSRPPGHNGNIYGPGYGELPTIDFAKNLKFYNNKCYRPNYDGDDRFAVQLEMWDSQGGQEIYNNEFHGGGQNIDLGGHQITKGASTYGVWIHDNLFDLGGQFSTSKLQAVYAIQLEGNNDQVIISGNHIIGYPTGVQISFNHSTSSPGITNVFIHNNLFEHMGFVDASEGKVIAVGNTVPDGGVTATINNVKVDNNTIIGNGATAGFSYDIPAPVTASDFYFRNNIVKGIVDDKTGTKAGFVLEGNATGGKSNFFIQNNISFGNTNSNNMFKRSGFVDPSPFTNNVPIKLDPLLDATFHLGAGSPAIDSGLNVGYPFSGSAPDIGAFEFTTQENLLNYSEDLTNAVWHHSAALSITPDDIIAPDCSLTADRVTTTTGLDTLYQTVAVSANTIYTFSFYAKKGTIGATDYNVQINNTSGASLTTKVDYSGLINTSTWTRISISFATDATTTQIIVLPKNGGGSVGTIWIWGAQLNRGAAAATYISTPAIKENLLNYSEDLTNAAWVHSGTISIASDVTTPAPDGTLTADKITATTAVDNLYQTVAVLPSTTYTFSFYAKKGTIGTTNYNVQINNTSGASLTTKVDYSGSINTGTWTRISVSFTTNASTTQIIVLPKNDGAIPGGTLWIWGAQLNRGAAAAAYIKTTGVVTVQQNLLTYSEELNNGAWAHNVSISISPDDPTLTAPDGTLTADKVTTSNGIDNLYQAVAVSPNTTYTFSFYAKKGTIGVTDYNVQINGTSGASLTTKIDYSGLINTTSWTRIATSFTTNATTTQIIVLPKNDGASAGTLWIWGAQLNKGAKAACYIKTTSTPIGFSPNMSNIISPELTPGIRVYPNPFKNSININVSGIVAGKLKLVLLDATGKIVWNKNISNSSNTDHESVNTSAFAKGIYLLKLIQNNTSSVFKLVKQ